MTTEKKKQQAKEQEQQQPPYYIAPPVSPEFAKVGELQLSSTAYAAPHLLCLLLEALQNKDVKKYLDVIPKRKMTGGYTG